MIFNRQCQTSAGPSRKVGGVSESWQFEIMSERGTAHIATKVKKPQETQLQTLSTCAKPRARKPFGHRLETMWRPPVDLRSSKSWVKRLRRKKALPKPLARTPPDAWSFKDSDKPCREVSCAGRRNDFGFAFGEASQATRHVRRSSSR